MANKFTGIGFKDISDHVENVFRGAFKDAVTTEAEFLNSAMEKSIIYTTDENVYSYPASPASMRKRRMHGNGGIGDPNNYRVFAFFPEGEGMKNINMEIVFTQKRDIYPQSVGGTNWEDKDFYESGDSGVARSMTVSADLRNVVEKGLKKWKQPYPRPYFEDTANELQEHVQIDQTNMVGEIAQSLRGKIMGQKYKSNLIVWHK